MYEGNNNHMTGQYVVCPLFMLKTSTFMIGKVKLPMNLPKAPMSSVGPKTKELLRYCLSMNNWKAVNPSLFSMPVKHNSAVFRHIISS